jgi:hypothetical protein
VLTQNTNTTKVKKMKLNIANLFKSKATKQEEENHRVQISEFENEINSAFEQMKLKGVEKIPVSIVILNSETRKKAAKEYAPELNQSFVSHDAKIYYPFEAYAKVDRNLWQGKQDYEIINLVTGGLSKEEVTSLIFADEIPGNMKEGFEVSNRFYLKISMNDLNDSVKKNLWYLTKTHFYEKNSDYVKQFAEIIADGGLTIGDFKSRISQGINEYRKQTEELSNKARVFDYIEDMERLPEEAFKPYLAVARQIRNYKNTATNEDRK